MFNLRRRTLASAAHAEAADIKLGDKFRPI